MSAEVATPSSFSTQFRFSPPNSFCIRRKSLTWTNETEFECLFGNILAGIRRFAPEPSLDTLGGVYTLRDAASNPVAVFKPCDEEAIPFDHEKNKMFVGKEIKPGIMFGEGYLKEVAAYLLDKDRFHGVPPTTLLHCTHPMFQNSQFSRLLWKTGSLQKYVPHIGSVEDVGWNFFPAREVHKIGILDCRILNTDRHMGNILVSDCGGDDFCRLVPIDHGLSLPSTLYGGYFEWISFPQAKQPFDQETLDFISRLDPDSDIEMLRQSLPNLRQECLNTLKICTLFLQRAAESGESGMSLFQIGCMMSRYCDIDEPCELEKMEKRIAARMKIESPLYDFWEIVDEEIDATLYY
jgi:hypothetical protein